MVEDRLPGHHVVRIALQVYSVDIALEMGQWAEQAAQASTSRSARFSISVATSTLFTLYYSALKGLKIVVHTLCTVLHDSNL